MGILKIDSAKNTDMTNTVKKYEVDSKSSDSAGSHGQTRYTPKWSHWHGYYRNIPEFKAVIDTLANYIMGKGFESDKKTKEILDRIKGWGKDDVNSILRNLLRCSLICGDGYAEMVRDKAGRLINIKPLNPGTMVTVVDAGGIIVRYEQLLQVETVNEWTPEEIFHISWNRLGDEVHGIPYAEMLEELIEMRNEAMRDMRIVFHRYVKPLIVTSVDTDDETEINEIKEKLDKAVKNGENIIVPSETVSQIQRVSIPQFSTLDPLPWLQYLIRVFTTSCGVPEVVLGWGGDTTEASTKILYMAFQQTVELGQLFMEEQLRLQARIKIKLTFPASIAPELQKDEKKDGSERIKNKVDASKDERK